MTQYTPVNRLLRTYLEQCYGGFEAREVANTLRTNIALARLFLSSLATAIFVFLCVGNFASAQSISNGGFESGLSGRSQTGSFYTFNNSAKAHSGSQYAYFGVAADGTTPLVNGSGSIDQSISIPSGASSVTLSFWLWVASDDSPTTAFDFLYVEVLNSSGSLLATLATYSNRDKSGSFNSTTPAYQQKTISLNSYAGQNIRVRFRGTTDASQATIFRLDDVSLTVSAAPTISSISPTTMTASTTALTTLTVNGSNFSTSGGQLQFTDPSGGLFSSAAHPERVVSVTSTQWVYTINNNAAVGTWQVRVVNADGQTSNSASFTVTAAAAAPTISLMEAVERFRVKALAKVDSDLDSIAQGFTDARELRRTLFWYNLFQPFLDAVNKVLEVLGLVNLPERGWGLLSWIRSGLEGANSIMDAWSFGDSINLLFSNFEAGTIERAISGPAYSATTKSMLDKAEVAFCLICPPAERTANYKAIVLGELLGSLNGSDSPIRVPVRRGDAIRSVSLKLSGAQAVKLYLVQQLNALEAELNNKQVSASVAAELIAYLDQRASDVLHATAGPVDVQYATYLVSADFPLY